MASRIDSLFAHIAELEHEIERELNQAGERWQYRIVAASDCGN